MIVEKDMKLSIVVPVYNMAADGKLNYCMDSLLGQTITDYEIIAVNDASTDNSLEILRDYEVRFPEKVKVLTYEKNKRQGGAKNVGMKAAKGEWIGFIDSDDWVTKDYYEKLLQKAEETGADVVSCDYSLVSEHTMEVGKVVNNHLPNQTGILDEEKHKSLILRSGSMVIKIFKHQILKENQLAFPEGIFYEDNCAGPLWLLYFTHFEKIDEPLYYYYQHSVSTVHSVSIEKCMDRMKAADLFLEECKKRGFLDKYRKEIEFRYTELYYVITLFSYMAGAKKKKINFIRGMRKHLEEQFPEFEKNEYYKEYIGNEEQKMIALQRKSDVLFYFYYLALNGYRKWKKARKQS